MLSMDADLGTEAGTAPGLLAGGGPGPFSCLERSREILYDQDGERWILGGYAR